MTYFSNKHRNTMTSSETKVAVHRCALLIGKSKPKVKIRTKQKHKQRQMFVPPMAQQPRPSPRQIFVKLSANTTARQRSSPRLVIFCVVLVLVIKEQLPNDTGWLVTARPYNNTNQQQELSPSSSLPSSISAGTTDEVKTSEQIHELVAATARSSIGGATGSTTSELSFEYLGLRFIPSVQLCKLEFQIHVNSVSFASNHIKSIESSAFICISLQLKILNLRNNKIQSISEDAFRGLGQLQVLVLEGNQLKNLPWKQLADSYLPSLRHLNLAYNKIGSIDASEPLIGSSLISLNLRGNPLEWVHGKSLSGLVKLKTLTLSQIELRSSHLARFDGMPELRFIHLDQLGENLSSIDGQFCVSSRKLATLSLKLNQLEQVPQFTSCQGLLSLDLSYNKIHGTLAGNFSRLTNLIDLYLGHNQLEHLGESAFIGLERLQVLDLGSNHLKTIHSNAFVPLRASLYELNIANNIQLSQLTSNGLERLISLKSYGNNQLRKLPAEFPAARQLVLTFAYHCCDYYNHEQEEQEEEKEERAQTLHHNNHHHHYQPLVVSSSGKKPAIVANESSRGELEGAARVRLGGAPLVLERDVGHNKKPAPQLDATTTTTRHLVEEPTNDELTIQEEARFAIHHGGGTRLGAPAGNHNDDRVVGDPADSPTGSLMSRWSNSVLSKLAQLWKTSFYKLSTTTMAGDDGQENYDTAALRLDSTVTGHNSNGGQYEDEDQDDDEMAIANPKNMSELVLWRPRLGTNNGMINASSVIAMKTATGAVAAGQKTPADDDEYFREPTLQQLSSSSSNNNNKSNSLTAPDTRTVKHAGTRPEMHEADTRRPISRRRRRLQDRRLESAPLAARESAAVIDELIWQASKIRLAHLHEEEGQQAEQQRLQPIRQIAPVGDGDDDELGDFGLGLGLVRLDSSDQLRPRRANDSLVLKPARAVPEPVHVDDTSLELRAELVARALAEELSSRYHSTKSGQRLREPSGGKWNPTKRATTNQDDQSVRTIGPDGRELSDSQDDVTLYHSRRSASPSNRNRAAGARRHQQQRFTNGGPITGSSVQCMPKPDAFQPCRDLFDSVWLRASISLVFLFAFAGNILVIVVLSSVKPSSSTSALTSIMWSNAAQSKRHIDVPRFLVINLAVADLMMAIYLGLLTFIDLSTLGEFRLHAIRWQYSTGCKLAGFLAVLSSELSVFILAIITLERNYAITNAVHLNRRLSLQKAMVIMFFGYMYALTMAILPLNGINDYRKFSICLPLDFDPNNLRSPASLYLILLISINTLSFVLLLSCYLRMYCAIRGSQAWSTNDLKIAKRMSILVVTDFLCWSPIILVAGFALSGYYLVGSNGLKVLIIFVLPLNSVANPFLYAITTKKFKRDLATLKKRLRIEQAVSGLARAFAYVTPICGLWQDKGAVGTVGGGGARSKHHQSASWTIRAGATAGGTGLEQIHSKSGMVAAKRNNKKLKQASLDHRQLAMDETRASASKQRQARLGKMSPVGANGGGGVTRQELLLVHQNGQSVIVNGHGQGRRAEMALDSSATPHSKLIRFRSTALDQLDHQQTIHADDLDKEQPIITQPRIVLDSVEPSPGTLRASSQTPEPNRNDPYHKPECRCRYNSLRHHVVYRKLSTSDTIGQHHQGYSSASLASDQQKRATSADKPNGTTNSLLSSLIVSHVEQTNNQRPSHVAVLGTQQLRLAESTTPTNDPGSCQTVIAGGDLGACGHKLKLPSANIRLLNCNLVDLMGAPSNRSVSACAFEWPVAGSGAIGADSGANGRDSVAGEGKLNYLTATAVPRACCSCSCDTIQANNGRHKTITLADAETVKVATGSRKSFVAKRNPETTRPMIGGRTKSISRFVFEPLAKAWSSIQLSLHQLGPTSSATTTTTTTAAAAAANLIASDTRIGTTLTTSSQLQRQAGVRIDSTGQLDETQGCSMATAKVDQFQYHYHNHQHHQLDNDPLSDSKSNESDELLVDFHESSIIEDVLQMSSPKRRQLLGGRRMSRSCDVIVETSTTTTTTIEPTSSSYYDQNDDQRILLATINQLNSRSRKKMKQISFERDTDEKQQVHHDRPKAGTGTVGSGQRRLNCTRCRSWSPALLDKLEVCMHQIRNRIPKFSNRNNLNQADGTVGERQQLQQSVDTNTDLDGEPDERALTNENLQQPSCVSSSSSSSSQCSSSSLNLSEPIDDEEEDEFNEVGLDDWARNMQKKAPPNCYSKSVSRRHRLRQQLSGNSDTLSARTVGSIENAVHPTVSSSLSLNISNNSGAKITDNHEP